MTDARVSEPPTTPLQVLGQADAAVCVGDFCDLPAHFEQTVVNRRVDADEV